MRTLGRIIAGKYELVRLLGRGSMGEVWVAHHRTLGEDVALKLLAGSRSPDMEAPSTATARFRFEAQVAARLSRKTRHIVRVTDHGEEDDLAYLVMELLEGETLETRLTRRRCLTRQEAPALVAQIARALTEAHAADVIHRDLKPANIFITFDEDGGLLVKLLDFGIARTMRTLRVSAFTTGQGLVFGTPGYMSPEQATPSSRLDHRCDLWALATVAYETLTGQLPISGEYMDEVLGNLCAGRIVPVHERDPSLPAGLAAFFAKAFARTMDDRYATASEQAQAFERAMAPSANARGPITGPPRSLRAHTLPLMPPTRSGARRDSHWATASSRARLPLVLLAPLAVLLSVPAAGMTWRALAHPSARATIEPAPMPSQPQVTLISPGALRQAAPAPIAVDDPELLNIAGDTATMVAIADSAPAPVLAAQRSPSPRPVSPPVVASAPLHRTALPVLPTRAPTPAPRSSARTTRAMDKSEVF